MKQGFRAGCSLEVTLKFADFENVKPQYNAEMMEEWDSSEDGICLDKSAMAERISECQDICREVCERKVDEDIYDVKEVKLFEQILKYKKAKTK